MKNQGVVALSICLPIGFLFFLGAVITSVAYNCDAVTGKQYWQDQCFLSENIMVWNWLGGGLLIHGIGFGLAFLVKDEMPKENKTE